MDAPTPGMIPSYLQMNRDKIIAWISGHDMEERKALFQVLDSLLYQRMFVNHFITPEQFPFSDWVARFATQACAYLNGIPMGSEVDEIKRLDSLRPPGLQLLPIKARSIVKDKTKPASYPSTSTSTLANAPGTLLKYAEARHITTGTYSNLVDSHAHARAILDEYNASNNKLGNAAVPDCGNLPEDYTGQKVLVQQLFEAVVDCSDVLDKKLNKKQGPIDNPQVTRVKNAPDVLIEAICWKILDAIKDAQSGNINIPRFTGAQPQYKPYESFEERFAKVVDSLKHSKAMFDEMMAPDFTRRLVAAPEAELKSKKKYSGLNSKKKELFNEGMKVLAARGGPTTVGSGDAPNHSTNG